MQNKFKDVPQESNTVIIFETPMKFDERDIVYQKWTSEGVTAESIVFVSNDIKEMNDEALEEYVRSSDIVNFDSQITISRGEKYSFINFNFEIAKY